VLLSSTGLSSIGFVSFQQKVNTATASSQDSDEGVKLSSVAIKV